MFKIEVPITKAKRHNNKLIIEGVASDTNLDRDEERFDINAVKSMEKSVNGNNLPIRVEHENKFYTDIGYWTEATVIDDKLAVKGEIDLELSLGKDVEVLLKRGKQIGLSVGGNIIDSEFVYDENTKKQVRVYKDVQLREISIVQNPSNYNTGLAMAKSFSGEKELQHLSPQEFVDKFGGLDKLFNLVIDKMINMEKEHINTDYNHNLILTQDLTEAQVMFKLSEMCYTYKTQAGLFRPQVNGKDLSNEEISRYADSFRIMKEKRRLDGTIASQIVNSYKLNNKEMENKPETTTKSVETPEVVTETLVTPVEEIKEAIKEEITTIETTETVDTPKTEEVKEEIKEEIVPTEEKIEEKPVEEAVKPAEAIEETSDSVEKPVEATVTEEKPAEETVKPVEATENPEKPVEETKESIENAEIPDKSFNLDEKLGESSVIKALNDKVSSLEAQIEKLTEISKSEKEITKSENEKLASTLSGEIEVLKSSLSNLSNLEALVKTQAETIEKQAKEINDIGSVALRKSVVAQPIYKAFEKQAFTKSDSNSHVVDSLEKMILDKMEENKIGYADAKKLVNREILAQI